jgi:tetratricopeptide (TPR) repeat protein
MNQENYEQKVEAYFDRNTSAEARAQLREEANGNPEFGAELDFGRRIKAAYSQQERDGLKIQLQQLEQKSAGNGWKVWQKVALAAAAAVALLLVALPNLRSTLLGMPDAGAQVVQFVPFANIYAAAGTSDNNEQAASDAYQAEQYSDAARLFGEVARQTPDRANDFIFYQAISLVGAGDFAGAMPMLERLSNQADFDFAMPALSYLAYCQYQTGQLPQAAKNAQTFLATPPTGQPAAWTEVMRRIAAGK